MSPTDRRRPARERLLDACDDLFYAQGIAATGVDALLARAGVAPGTLYAHFGGKDWLVAAYLERRHLRWRTTWDRSVERADGPVERLLALFDALADFRREAGAGRGCAVLAAAAEVVDPQHPARVWIEADTALLLDRLRELAEQAGARDPAGLAADLLLVYDGVLAAHARAAALGPAASPVAEVPGRELAELVVRRHLCR